MKNLFLYLLFTFLIQVSTTANNYLFKVFYVKGDVVINHNSKKSSLEKDNLVYSGDNITLEEKSMIVLLNTEDKSMVIEKAGTYSTKKIEKLFQNIDHENLTQEYYSYVVEEFMHHKGEKTSTGAVSRGHPIEMLSPRDSCVVINNELVFQWNNPENKDLWFYIYSLTGERLFESHGKVSALTLFLDKSSDLNVGETYLWKVSTNQFPEDGDDFYNEFTLANEEQKQLFENDMKVIKDRFTNSDYSWDEETNLLLLYGFYLKNRLFLEANQTKKDIMDKYQDSPLVID